MIRGIWWCLILWLAMATTGHCFVSEFVEKIRSSYNGVLDSFDGMRDSIDAFGPKECVNHILRMTSFEAIRRFIGPFSVRSKDVAEVYLDLHRRLDVSKVLHINPHNITFDDSVDLKFPANNCSRNDTGPDVASNSTNDYIKVGNVTWPYKPSDDPYNVTNLAQVFRYMTHAGATYCKEPVAYRLSGLRLGANETAEVMDDSRIIEWRMNDTYNYIISKSEVTKTITVAFRGTSNPTEMKMVVNGRVTPVDQADYPGAPANSMAFRSIYQAALRQFPAIIKTLKRLKKAHPDFNTVAVGHSLGGAIAEYLALYLRSHPVGFIVDALYTIEEPIIGTPDFSTWSVAKIGRFRIVRITVSNDIVPNLRRGRNGEYGHAREGIELYFPSAERTTHIRCNDIEDRRCSINLHCRQLSWEHHSTLFGIRYSSDLCTMAA